MCFLYDLGSGADQATIPTPVEGEQQPTPGGVVMVQGIFLLYYNNCNNNYEIQF